MKTIRLIGTVLLVALAIYISDFGTAGFQSVGLAQKISIEKVTPSDVIQLTLEPAGQLKQDKSIFSTTTIISLVVAVIGIVAFRRKTYL